MSKRDKMFLGIDLGTSSVKVLAWYENGICRKTARKYREISPCGWWTAVRNALSEIDLKHCCGIGLSSQVGTYVINKEDVISWSDPAGRDEIDEIRAMADADTWIREIGMIHPALISYPLPRLLYFRKQYPALFSVRMPKEELIRRLTGETLSDPWSWRGLADPKTRTYSTLLLDRIGVSADVLPPLADPFSCAGYTKRLNLKGGAVLPEGIPVYTGMNDFYASLAAMGVTASTLFDITGTSEHLGIVTGTFTPDPLFPSGPYLDGYVRYGVTASGGEALRFAQRLWQGISACNPKKALCRMNSEKMPVFLPYLNGERAPIFDPDACGVFFGLTKNCDAELLTYSILEGIVFSLYHIYESIGCPDADAIRAVGGACAVPLLNRLKAELFEMPVLLQTEQETSAMGAVMAAAVGSGMFRDLKEAQQELCRQKETVYPGADRQLRARMLERYAMFRELYPALQKQMVRFREI